MAASSSAPSANASAMPAWNASPAASVSIAPTLNTGRLRTAPSSCQRTAARTVAHREKRVAVRARRSTSRQILLAGGGAQALRHEHDVRGQPETADRPPPSGGAVDAAPPDALPPRGTSHIGRAKFRKPVVGEHHRHAASARRSGSATRAIDALVAVGRRSCARRCRRS